jgi:hypothetical protein
METVKLKALNWSDFKMYVAFPKVSKKVIFSCTRYTSSHSPGCDWKIMFPTNTLEEKHEHQVQDQAQNCRKQLVPHNITTEGRQKRDNQNLKLGLEHPAREPSTPNLRLFFLIIWTG